MNKSKYNLKAIRSKKDIPKKYLNTPIEKLLSYHNFKSPLESYNEAIIGIIKCIDNRERLNIPINFAYIVRSAGAKIHNGEFNLSVPIALNNIKYFAIIGHTDCRMVNLFSKKTKVIKGLAKNTGWSTEEAKRHFLTNAPIFQTENERISVYKEQERLKIIFPKVTFVPMIYKVEDSKLYLVE